VDGNGLFNTVELNRNGALCDALLIGLDVLSTLCCPSRSTFRTGENDEKADFDAGRGCAKGGRFLSDEFGLS
jgi:hypothetical protein